MIEFGPDSTGWKAPALVCAALAVGVVAGALAVAPATARGGESLLGEATETRGDEALEGRNLTEASRTQQPVPGEKVPTEGEQIPTEEEQVLAVVQAFFDGLAAGPDALNATLLEEGSVTRLRDRDGTLEWTIQTFAQMNAATAQDDTRMLERMWDATVLVHGPLAQVWTPYDFYANGEFSHCGVDSFTLIKTAQGWKVSGVAYTVEPTGCAPSPLGPPRLP